MIRLAGSHLTLVAFTGAAVLLLAGGIGLSARTREVRATPDRGALRELARSLQAELGRLGNLQVRNLNEIVTRFPSRVADPAREIAAEFVGVRAIAIIRADQSRVGIALRTDPLEASPLPDLMLASPDAPASTGGTIPLARSVVFARDPGAEREGWVESPAHPPTLVFWSRRDDSTATAVILDRAAIEDAVSTHLQHWVEPRYAGVRSARGLDRFETRNGRLLAGSTDIPGRSPDFVIPMAARFGEWQIVSWDRFESRREYQPVALALAVAGAGILLVAGGITAQQQRRLQRLAEQRVSFVNQVSHEFGAPLTNMLLNLDLAHDALVSAPAEVSRRLGLIREEAERLGRLVANVLTFSRGERRTVKLRPAPCRPTEILAQTLAQFAPALARRHIAVAVRNQYDGELSLDADVLAQIAANLISNAEKYATSGGRLEIESMLTGREYIVRIADDGPGIPPEARERIFAPFQRVSNRTTEGVSGSGLGLAIARSLAELMGGTLQLLPSPAGARFELRIPAIPVLQ